MFCFGARLPGPSKEALGLGRGRTTGPRCLSSNEVGQILGRSCHLSYLSVISSGEVGRGTVMSMNQISNSLGAAGAAVPDPGGPRRAASRSAADSPEAPAARARIRVSDAARQNGRCIARWERAPGSPSGAARASSHSKLAGVLRSISEIPSCFFGPRPWHIEIRHSVNKTFTINSFGFETLKLKIRRLKLWKPTVRRVCPEPPSLPSPRGGSKR